MLPNPFFRLGLALPLHQLGWAPPGAHLSLCLRCRPVSPIRDLCNLPELIHIILGLPSIPTDRMGASQVVSMQGTGDAGRVGCTLHLLSRTLTSNDAQLGMVMALLWTPLPCGE